MADPLVETKLLLPRVRRDTVARPRLDGLLDRSVDAPVTVVSAPAGFGKTTLLSARVATWLAGPANSDNGAGAGAGDARAAAWVSLTDRDRQPGSYWTYVLHALDRAVPGSGAAALALLQSGQASTEAAVASVVNELSVHPGEVILVLDDYHLADNPDVAEAMTFLVDHLPPQLRLVISTRADPALPLARLRARGELVEIRAADLRFTSEEAAAYLNDIHNLDLTAADVAALEARTEGWAAALQLAVLSLRDRADASAFIAGFAGDDRFVVDYLAEEVLGRQPDDVRRFLLDTSILDRLTGPLCDAVSPVPDGQSGPGGRAMLDLLERQNLFVVPLDDHRRWYRYHHLFADVLHAHLLQERPGDVPELHARASRWYAENGHTEDAIRHAIAAGDTETAADLVERALPDLRRERREHDIVAWAGQLPADVVDRRPVLAVGLIGAFMASNDIAGVEERIQDAERLLKSPPPGLVGDADELAKLPAALEVYRAGLALVAQDPAGAISHAEAALNLAVAGDDLTVAAASGLMGLAFWTTGDVVAAHRAYTAAADGLTRTGHIPDVLGCSLTIADMELTLGHLRDAENTLRQALDLAERHASGSDMVMRGTADMLVALSRIAWHRDDLGEVADLLRRADELGEPAGLPQNPYRWRVGMARLRAAERNWPSALELLDDAQRVYVGDFSPPVHPIHATRARLLIASGDVAGARAWAREHQVGADDELSYLREYEHLTLARLLLAEHRTSADPAALQQATALLDRLLEAAENGERLGTVLEVEVLRAIAYRTTGDQVAAQRAFAHALELAEPEGWPRFFLDAPGLTDFLHALALQRPTSTFLRQLLARRTDQPAPQPTTAIEPRVPPQSLLDPLSDRELDVLRLLGSDLDGPAIARELVVSLNTVRTHTKHIYTKLGVNNRRAAISKAHQLGLLSRSARA